MNWPDAYSTDTVNNWIERLENLKPDTKPQWGKMNSGQLLAHLNVTYDLASGKVNTASNAFMRWMLKTFVKKSVVGPKAYPKHSRTAPAFIVSDKQDFEEQKAKFIANIRLAQEQGVEHHEGLPSPSFGPLTAEEWNVTYSKHIEHHFEQFGL